MVELKQMGQVVVRWGGGGVGGENYFISYHVVDRAQTSTN